MSNLSKEAEKLNRKRKRTWLRRILTGLGALAAVFLVFIGLLLPATTRDEGLQTDAKKGEGAYGVLDPEFWADAFSIYALVGSSIEDNILASDGNNYHISVRWEEDAGIPEGSSLSVDEILDQEVYDQYVQDTAAALGVEPETISYARFFDISILDKEGRKIQPAEGKNVDVRIELAEELSDSARAVHFADDGAVDVLDVTIGAKEPEEGEDVTGSGTSQEGTLEGAAPKEPENGNGEEGGSAAESASGADSGIVLMKSTVSFAASSFSVYAIVDAPEPVITEGTRVQNLSELARQYSYESGFYLSYGSTYYFINTLNPNSAFEETSNMAEASRWYFKAVEGSENTYVIYTYVNDEKKYMQNTSGNLMGLTTVPDAAVFFEISQAAGSKFYFKKKTENKWLQHSNGGRGIRFYTDKNNAANSQISITYATDGAMANDPYSLDGKTYGIAYHDDSAISAALTAESKTVEVNKVGQSRLSALDMLMRPDVLNNEGILLVAEGSDIQEWTFHSIKEDRYYITTEVNGEKKYLAYDGANVTLTVDEGFASAITATPGTGAYSGKWHFNVDGYSLNLPNGSSNGFNAASGSGDTTWMNLVQKSVLTDDDFNLYTAQKVSVSDTANVYNGQQVVIYTRIWNENKKKYEFYAVNHDGALVRCYDTGDNIEWIGSQVNTALWTFTEYTNTDGTVNYYYELQNTQYGNYIAPQVSGGQTMSDSTIGINLNGRRYGENYTTIIAWDDTNYQYVGLKTENGKVVACPLSEAEDFYFAIINPINVDDELATVTTVNNNDYGITMKMIDFNNPIVGDRDSVQHAFFGSHKNGYEQGLLSTNLDENTGYPSTTSKTGVEHSGKSLNELFKDREDGADLFTGMTDVNQLFLQSIYNESGYFEYDSTQNFATLLDANGNLTNTFTVYDQLAAIGTSTGMTRTHGQFMPYNSIEAGKYAYDDRGNLITNQTDVLAKELPDSDPRKGEALYSIPQKDADYFFGMQMEADFTQTASGLDAWGHDIIFEFSGDDDFWLYVDGELILDLGGVRQAMTGTVNFRTGQIVSSNNITLKTATGTKSTKTYTLREVFESNYRTRNENATAADVAEYLTQYFDEGSTVFKDYTNHKMSMFYMERGAGASNLHLRFNLAAVKQGTFLLSKKLSGTELEDSSLIEFPYQIYYKTTQDGESGYHLLGTEDGEEDLVLYEGSTRTLNSAGKYKSLFTPAQGTVPYSHVFFLKPGETAEVSLPAGAKDYYVVECGVNPDIYDEVSANGDKLTGTDTRNTVNSTARKDYATSADTTENRSEVEYDNHVSKNAMRTLSITKKLYDVNGTTELTYPDPETSFSFRLYLGDENADASALPLSDLYPYYIKDTAGHYCRWDAGDQKFVSLGDDIKTYDALQQFFTDNNWTDAQKESVIFKTSMNGSISKIPAGYTVEVRNLVISTQYKVEERDWEIPKGYTRREADGYARVDEGHETTQRIPYTGTIASGEDPEIEVRNQKGWGLTAEKKWTDKDFMASHDNIYFAVYVGEDLAQIPDHTEEVVDETTQDISYTTGYKDCVRAMRSPETELYFFFGDLYNGGSTTHQFAEYTVKEVQLTGTVPVQLDEEGYVTNLSDFTVTPIEGNGTLTIGGTPVGGTHKDGYAYTVGYQIGEITGHNENIRTDTVTNSRPGIKLYKTDWTGGWMTGDNGKATLSGALSGAKFTLKDSAGNDVAAASYTSGADGLITIAYLNAGTYSLAEIETPNGYVRLDSPITITVADNGVVTVSGVDDSYYTLDTSIDTTMAAVITIKNRATELEVKKVDEKTKAALAGVHFALYRQVTDSSGNTRKDYLPMTGYEDLVTDENGILPKVTMALAAGTYYLTETQTQSGYALLSEDICFTIGKDGTVTLNNGADTGSTIARTEDAGTGKTTYELTIPNYKLGVKLKKVDDHSGALTGAKFSLYIKNAEFIWETVSGYGEIDMTATSVTTLSDLKDGQYKLTETIAPAGYVILENAIFFKIDNGVVQLTKEDGITPADSEKAKLSTETDQNKNTVYVITVINTPGTELPSTGGPGMELFQILGAILMFAGSLMLLRRMKVV